MKLLPKLALLGAVGGVLTGAGATLWGAPGVDLITGPAAAARAAMLDDLHEVQHAQAAARKDKDVIKLNCVNDKLVQIKPELNIADHAMTQLQVASDPVDQKAAALTVTQAADRVHKLREGAAECAGNRALATESANAYTHPDITDNPTANQYEQTMESPIYASPFD